MKNKLLAVFFVLLCSICSQAQGTSFMTGFQPYYQYDSFDVGNVNVNNGLINLKIPLISYPQRGTLPSVDFWVRYYPTKWTVRWSGTYWYWEPASLNFGISLWELAPYVGLARYHTDLRHPPVDYAYHAVDSTGAH